MFVDTIHVADAVSDTDETCGAYAAAGKNAFNNTNGNINNANNRKNNANYRNNNSYSLYINICIMRVVFYDWACKFECTCKSKCPTLPPRVNTEHCPGINKRPIRNTNLLST